MYRKPLPFHVTAQANNPPSSAVAVYWTKWRRGRRCHVPWVIRTNQLAMDEEAKPGPPAHIESCKGVTMFKTFLTYTKHVATANSLHVIRAIHTCFFTCSNESQVLHYMPLLSYHWAFARLPRCFPDRMFCIRANMFFQKYFREIFAAHIWCTYMSEHMLDTIGAN